MMCSRAALAAAAAALLVQGCGDSNGPSQPTPRFLRAVVQANPHNVISARVAVGAELYDSVFVRYWAVGVAAERTPSVPFAGDTVALVPVLGLLPETAYSFEINLVRSGAPVALADTVPFGTGVLPIWLPRVSTSGTDTTPGLLALSLPGGGVIVNNAGRVVWYREFPNGVLNSFQAHPNGRYTILGVTTGTDAFHVLDVFGEELGTLSCVGLPTRFHDLKVLQAGDAWILCDETRVMDLTAVGGVANASVTGTVVQHVSPTGQVLFQWNSFDHFAITDMPQEDRTGPNVNFTHGNGVELDTDGNLLLSFRSLNEITKVDVQTGQIVWRFGGLRNEFTIQDDPKGRFDRQHGLRSAGAGQIQMLDNGVQAPSRFVRYAMDAAARTARLTLEYVDAPTTWTSVGGGTEFYAPNGHGLVSFGRAGRVAEVGPSGSRAWEVTGLDGTYVFRAQRIPSLYAPGDPLRGP